ncbi:unnamed protein product [Schistosoma rodhaini]|uniref:Uncharacterized protein n=1 Tax=Schistosoma rodhaini TaxID=6188 RepID=A0AA85FQB2_9TREM|nr:unnamed protein product [Schistosoma rodhaini]
MKLLNIRQLILVIFLNYWSQCLGYVTLMSEENDRQQQRLQTPLYYHEGDITSNEQPYYEGTGEMYDTYQVTPYDYYVDEGDNNNNNDIEYEYSGTYSNGYPNSDYEVNYGENDQYYGPVEYSGTYNDYEENDYNTQYDEYYPRRDVFNNYQTKTMKRHPSSGEYNDDQKNDYENENNYEGDVYNDYNSYNTKNTVDNLDYSNLPTTSYKHQKYVPYRIIYLNGYFPIDNKLYIFYPKKLKKKYYTLRTIDLKYGQFDRHFSSEIAKKSSDGYFKEMNPNAYNKQYSHSNYGYNNNHNHYYSESKGSSNYYPSNYQSYHTKRNHRNHNKNNNAKSLYNNNNPYKYSTNQNYNDYIGDDKLPNDLFLFDDTLKTTDYEESISYHHSGEQDPKV